MHYLYKSYTITYRPLTLPKKKNLGLVFMSNFRTFLGHIFTRHALDYYNNLQ